MDAAENFYWDRSAAENRIRGLAARAATSDHDLSTLIPRTGIQVRLMPQVSRLVARMPPGFQQRMFQYMDPGALLG